MSTTVANLHSHLNVCYEKLFPREPSTFPLSRHEERMANMHQSIKTISLQLSVLSLKMGLSLLARLHCVL